MQYESLDSDFPAEWAILPVKILLQTGKNYDSIRSA
jgi:hypothetical protein